MKKALALVGTVALVAVATAGIANSALARDEIRIVGSSTVFPFATAVAEEFGKTSGFKTPVIESTGSGGGLKLFCEGVGTGTVDITNSSRRIKKSEVETCAKNGVADIHEVRIGFDGIVIAHAKDATSFSVTREILWKALAKEVPVNGQWVANPYKTWKEVDASLPDQKIEVLGPPPTSGTRDAFNELAMDAGCASVPEVKALKDAGDNDRHKQVCQSLREDGGFVEAGENDNLIVQKIAENKSALGIFGYSFLDANRDKISALHVDGVEPTYENISAGTYPISRTLFFYVKKAHIGVIPGIQEYINLWVEDDTFGPFGFLADKGLIALPDAERDAERAGAKSMENLKL
ncbi:MAG: PstS family phosphate ABC transporter substrate-binding protein [Alphaproteobacteria bacterium]